MARERKIINAATGEYEIVPLTSEEEAAADAYVGPDPAAFDQDNLNAALVESGSVVRALGLVMFAEINKLRVANGDAAYTLNQFKNALKAQMR
jgi:hypothetical protein